MRTVLFLNGETLRRQVYIVGGAAMAGEPTAYVIRYGQTVWVVPGVSVDFVESN